MQCGLGLYIWSYTFISFINITAIINYKIYQFQIISLIKLMGCYFCVPNEKYEVKTLESDINLGIFELKALQKQSQRLYTVGEEQYEASECSESKKE